MHLARTQAHIIMVPFEVHKEQEDRDRHSHEHPSALFACPKSPLRDPGNIVCSALPQHLRAPKAEGLASGLGALKHYVDDVCHISDPSWLRSSTGDGGQHAACFASEAHPHLSMLFGICEAEPCPSTQGKCAPGN